MYKFEIYRNRFWSTSGGFTDESRYDEDLYHFERELDPIWDDIAFKYTRENGRIFFRKYLDGSFSLIGEDFTWANTIRTSNRKRNEYRILKIYEIVDGVRVLRWRGFFSVIAGEWDLDRCVVSFSDLVIWDEYTKVLENIEEERNLFDIAPQPVIYNLSGYEYESKQVILASSPFDPISPCATGLPLLSSSDYFLDETCAGDDCGYVLYARVVALTTLNGVFAWYVQGTYRRDYVVQVNQPGAEWTSLGLFPDATSTTYKWVRNYLNITAPTYSSQIIIIQYTDPTGYVWVCAPEGNNLQVSSGSELTEYENTRARRLPQVINYAFNGASTQTPFNSRFFTDTTNPVTGSTNELNNLYILQFSDIKETSDAATRAMYSFKDIESWLAMFNVYWYMDGKYGATFEHKKFFDLGLSYSANSIGLDVSDYKEAVSTSKLSYGNKGVPRIMEIKLFYESGDDFYGSPILFNGSMANWGEESKLSISTQNLSTDLMGAVLGSDAGLDGFMLIATERDSPNFVYHYIVINGEGALTGATIVNSPLSVANIEDNYWRWGGQTDVGVMNEKNIEFDSVENNVIQEDFSITSCDITFNPYKLVRTEYGDGRVEEATHFLKDKKLTLALSYGA